MGIRKIKGISQQSGVFPFCFYVSQKCKTDENMVFKIIIFCIFHGFITWNRLNNDKKQNERECGWHADLPVVFKSDQNERHV